MPRVPDPDAVLTTDSSHGERPSPRPLRVLALASYPEEAAATRCRILQFIVPLAEGEITVDSDRF